MTIRILLLLLILLPVTPAAAGQSADPSPPPAIASAEVIGLPPGDLSSDLRRAVDGLAGTPFDRERLSALLMRIESEIEGTTAAVRDVTLPDGRIRITFVVMRINPDVDAGANVNRRYRVADVEVRGIDENRLSQDLRDALHSLVGRSLEEGEAEALADRLRKEVQSGEAPPDVFDYEVETRVSRGDDQGEVTVRFVLRRTEASRWVPFAPAPSKLVYHQRQGWSGAFEIPMGSHRNRFTLGLIRGNNDDLVEEFSGYSLRVETREVVTDRVGLGFEFARYRPEWRAATIDAIGSETEAPVLYDRRTSITPSITIALTRQLRLTTGISATELRHPSDAGPDLEAGSTQATAWFIRVGFEREIRDNRDVTHRLSGQYDWRGGRTGIGSDLTYDQHRAALRYDIAGRDSRLLAAFEAGRLSGDTPLFARFSLGDTHSLRGWDKYAVAPSGGDRMAHGSVEYGYKWFRYFIDAGSVWQEGANRRFRSSTGVGFDIGPAFLIVGVPLNGDGVTGSVMLGLRSSVSFGHARLP